MISIPSQLGAVPESTGERVCPECGVNRTTAFICGSCILEKIRVQYPPGDGGHRRDAKRAKLASYYGICAVHGETLFSTKTGLCRNCTRSRRAVARDAGLTRYIENCAVHGSTWFHVNTGKCLTCFTSTGARRVGSETSPRAQARAAGHPTYLGRCEVHGETAHSVGQGKCLTCFTTAGVPRRAASVMPPDEWAQLRSHLVLLGYTPAQIAIIVAEKDRSQ